MYWYVHPLLEHTSVCMLKLWTINGRLVESIKLDVRINCLTYTSAPEGVYVNVLVGGLANGNIR